MQDPEDPRGRRGGHLTAFDGLLIGECFTGEPPNCANAEAGNGEGILRGGLATDDGEAGCGAKERSISVIAMV